MPIGLLEWLQKIFKTTITNIIRVSPTGILSVRTDPTINDIDVYTGRQVIHIEDVVSTAADIYYIDISPNSGKALVLRDAHGECISHAENAPCWIRLYPEGLDSRYTNFPAIPASTAGNLIGEGCSQTAVARIQLPLILSNPNAVIRVYMAAADAARTLRFTVIFNEVKE